MIAVINSEKTGALALLEVNERNLYAGNDLSELLDMAAIERKLVLLAGSNHEVEIEAVYSIETSEWLVQVFDHSNCLARSLYESTN